MLGFLVGYLPVIKLTSILFQNWQISGILAVSVLCEAGDSLGGSQMSPVLCDLMKLVG